MDFNDWLQEHYGVSETEIDNSKDFAVLTEEWAKEPK